MKYLQKYSNWRCDVMQDPTYFGTVKFRYLYKGKESFFIRCPSYNIDVLKIPTIIKKLRRNEVVFYLKKAQKGFHVGENKYIHVRLADSEIEFTVCFINVDNVIIKYEV